MLTFCRHAFQVGLLRAFRIASEKAAARSWRLGAT
jgi:hypothetical protein